MAFEDAFSEFIEEPGSHTTTELLDIINLAENANQLFILVVTCFMWVNQLRDAPGFESKQREWRGILYRSFERLRYDFCPGDPKPEDDPLHDDRLGRYLGRMDRVLERWRRIMREKKGRCPFRMWLKEKQDELPSILARVQNARLGIQPNSFSIPSEVATPSWSG